jgi:hypothetical protein
VDVVEMVCSTYIKVNIPATVPTTVPATKNLLNRSGELLYN